VNNFGIDVETKDKAKLIRRLRALKTTETAEDGGEYHENRQYSQVWITTSWTPEQLDDWLYRTKGVEYVGIFDRSEKCAREQ
jgi:hypothetical protein